MTTLQEITQELEHLTPERLQGFVQEMSGVFLKLRDGLVSADPHERKDAIQSALELKKSLEQEIENLREKTGVEPDAFLQAADLGPEYRFIQEEIQRMHELFRPKGNKL